VNPDKPEYVVSYPTWEEADSGHLDVMRQLRTQQIVIQKEASSSAAGWVSSAIFALVACGILFAIFR
jgi:hypothetical protein